MSEKYENYIRLKCRKCGGRSFFEDVGLYELSMIKGCPHCNFTGHIYLRHYNVDHTSCDGKMLIPKHGRHLLTCSKCGIQADRRNPRSLFTSAAEIPSDLRFKSNEFGSKLNIYFRKLTNSSRRFSRRYKWILKLPSGKKFVRNSKSKFELSLDKKNLTRKDLFTHSQLIIKYKNTEVSSFRFYISDTSHLKQGCEFYNEDDKYCVECRNRGLSMCLKKFRNQMGYSFSASLLQEELRETIGELEYKQYDITSPRSEVLNFAKQKYLSGEHRRMTCPLCATNKYIDEKLWIVQYRTVEIPETVKRSKYSSYARYDLKNMPHYLLKKYETTLKRKTIHEALLKCPKCGYEIALYFDNKEPIPKEIYYYYIEGKYDKFCDRTFTESKKCLNCSIISIFCKGLVEKYRSYNEKERKKFIKSILHSEELEDKLISLGDIPDSIFSEYFTKSKNLIKLFYSEKYQFDIEGEDYGGMKVDWRTIRGGKDKTFVNERTNEEVGYVSDDPKMGFASNKEAFSWVRRQMDLLYEINRKGGSFR